MACIRDRYCLVGTAGPDYLISKGQSRRRQRNDCSLQQDRNRRWARTVIVCNCQVKVAVSVEITHHHREGKRPGAVVSGGSERPIAVTQEHTYARDSTVLGAVSNHQVQLAVAIEVSHRYRKRR